MKLKLFFTLSCLLFYVVCFAQHERYTYDANGNILSMTVNNGNGPQKNLTYFYDPKHTGNRLIYVHDNLTGKDYHFAYDAIGELIKDELHGITNVIYDIRNNPTQVEKADGTILTYEYDAFSHCISSNTMKPGQPTVHEVYVVDIQGNRMSTYRFVDTANAHLHQTETGLFGNDQLGVNQIDVDMSKPFDPTKPTTFERGHKLYFLRNQVGTVVAIVSDEKRAIPKADNPAIVDHYEAILLSASDYSPYGAISRSYNADSMPYGFNGQLKRPEITRNHYTANFWEYDADLGRRWNLDPKGNASVSPYATFNDNPIWFSDPFGDSTVPGAGFWSNVGNGIKDGWGDTKQFAKNLGTLDGWKNLANGVNNINPFSIWSPESMKSSSATGDKMVNDVKGIPNMTKDDWGHALGYGTEKTTEAIVLSKGASTFGSVAEEAEGVSLAPNNPILKNTTAAISSGSGLDNIKYIGRLEDLKVIPRNQTFLDQLPNLGNPKANYYQNMSILRKALRDGYVIKDASWFRLNSELAPTFLNPNRTVGQTFLGAERNLLKNKGLWP